MSCGEYRVRPSGMLNDWNSRAPDPLLGVWPPRFTAESYRKEAERVRQLADAAASNVIRAELLDFAQQYEDLAALAQMRTVHLMSTDAPIRLSAEDHDFHRREVLRLHALAETITTPAVRARVLAQAEEHARLIGFAENIGGSE